MVASGAIASATWLASSRRRDEHQCPRAGGPARVHPRRSGGRRSEVRRRSSFPIRCVRDRAGHARRGSPAASPLGSGTDARCRCRQARSPEPRARRGATKVGVGAGLDVFERTDCGTVLRVLSGTVEWRPRLLAPNSHRRGMTRAVRRAAETTRTAPVGGARRHQCARSSARIPIPDIVNARFGYALRAFRVSATTAGRTVCRSPMIA